MNTQGVLFCELYGELLDIVEGRRGFTPPAAATPHPPPSGAPVSLRVGRSADLTGHRPVIQHCGPLKGKALGGAPSGGRLTGCRGRKKEAPGRVLPCMLFDGDDVVVHRLAAGKGGDLGVGAVLHRGDGVDEV